MPRACPPGDRPPRPSPSSPTRSRGARPHRYAGAVGPGRRPCWRGPPPNAVRLPRGRVDPGVPALPVRAAASELSGARAQPAPGLGRTDPHRGRCPALPPGPSLHSAVRLPCTAAPGSASPGDAPRVPTGGRRRVCGSPTREQPDLPLLFTCFRRARRSLRVLGGEASAAGGGDRLERIRASWPRSEGRQRSGPLTDSREPGVRHQETSGRDARQPVPAPRKEPEAPPQQGSCLPSPGVWGHPLCAGHRAAPDAQKP